MESPALMGNVNDGQTAPPRQIFTFDTQPTQFTHSQSTSDFEFAAQQQFVPPPTPPETKTQFHTFLKANINLPHHTTQAWLQAQLRPPQTSFNWKKSTSKSSTKIYDICLALRQQTRKKLIKNGSVTTKLAERREKGEREEKLKQKHLPIDFRTRIGS